MTITTTDIRELRQATGAGIMDCKRALEDAAGDRSAAALLLKERGLLEIEKRAERAMREGRVFLRRSDARIALAALSCETDFVSRGGEFIAAGEAIAARVCEEGLRSPDPAIEEAVIELGRKFKENIALGGMTFVDLSPGELSDSYLHGEGSIGAIVRARASGPRPESQADTAALIHDLALHVAAYRPRFVDQKSIPDSHRREKEEAFRQEIAEDERLRSKPAAMLESILAGKLRKHWASVSLLDQAFVKDESVTVAQALARHREARGVGLEVMEFALLQAVPED